MKLIDDNVIDYKRRREIIHDIDRFIGCHNAWIDLWELFLSAKNPTLGKFLDYVDDRYRLTANNSDVDYPKIHAMKAAILLMSKHMEKSMSTDDLCNYYEVLEQVSDYHNINTDVISDMINHIKQFLAEITENHGSIIIHPDDTIIIEYDYLGGSVPIRVTSKLIRDLLRLTDMQLKDTTSVDNTRDSIYSSIKESEEYPAVCEKHKVVTLCGSTRFKDEFMKVAAELTRDGYIVLMPHVFSHSESEYGLNHCLDPDKLLNMNLANSLKSELLNIHLAKIDMSDEIFVINKDGYIGDGTKQEIKYASEHGKIIRFVSGEGIIDNE